MANKSRFERIFLHCSDSEWGTAHIIDNWHKERKIPFKEIGYHEVVQNGYPTADWYNKKIKISYLEGAVEIGRAINSDEWFEKSEMGAHVKGFNTNSYGILFDVERCIGCNACAMACKAEFGWPKGHFVVKVDPVERGIFPKVDKNFIRKACMHCSEATCMMACPVEAIIRNQNGAVVIDEKRCIGCQYCVVNCPFGVPQYNSELGKSFKCNF